MPDLSAEERLKKLLDEAVEKLNLRFPVAEIARKTGYSKGVVSTYLRPEGRPSESFIETFQKSFNISLLNPLRPYPESSIETFEVKDHQEHVFLENTNGNKFELLPSGLYQLTVELIPAKAYARYISEYNDVEHLDGFETVPFLVDRYARGNYKAFEIKGDSMDDGTRDSTPDKAIALGRELLRDRWPRGFRDAQYGWIIVTRNNIVFKDITSMDKETGMIICHSRNSSPEYSDFSLSLDEDVKQIFKVIKRQF